MKKLRNIDGDNVVVSGAPIDFLGYQFYHEKTLLRKSIKQKFCRKIKCIKNPNKMLRIKSAYWGWTLHGDCRHLWNQITNCDMSFGEYGIKGRIETKDGQKFYDVEQVSLEQIVKDPITVLDFEPNIKTKFGPDRYVVKILHEGAEKKLITNSFTIKSQLNQARDGNILPQQTRVIKKQIDKGKWDYYFE